MCKTSCLEEHHNKLKLPLSFQVPVNGATQEKSRTVSNTNSSFSTNLALLPMKNGLSNKGLPCHTVIRNGDSVSNNSKEAFEVKQSLSFPGEVFEQFTHETSDTFLEPKPPQTSRKRHLSEVNHSSLFFIFSFFRWQTNLIKNCLGHKIRLNRFFGQSHVNVITVYIHCSVYCIHSLHSTVG